jgi:hypothetical protein
MVRDLKLKLFAALVLRAMAREQAEKGTKRIFLRSEGLASQLGLEPDSPQLVVAEHYLAREGYISPSTPDYKDGSFTITETGWQELGYERSVEGWRRRPWWKRMLGA